jgi:hypothetical protein
MPLPYCSASLALISLQWYFCVDRSEVLQGTEFDIRSSNVVTPDSGTVPPASNLNFTRSSSVGWITEQKSAR